MDTVNQHPTTTHFSIQEILPRNRTALFVESKPSVSFRKGHEDNAAPTFAVVIAPVPKTTQTSNLLPLNGSGVRPFFYTPFRTLASSQVGFCVMFSEGMGNPLSSTPSTPPFP